MKRSRCNDLSLHDGRIRPGRACRAGASISSHPRQGQRPSDAPKDNTHDQRSCSAASGYTERQGTRSVSGKIRDHQGRFRRRGHARLGASGGRPFLQSGEARIFYGRRIFPQHTGLYRAVWIERGPGGQQGLANANIKDDPGKQSNAPGTITFATAGPNTRTTQLFINFGNNTFLDSQGFSPFGKVISGMDVVKKLYSGYGERPDQGSITNQGKAYLDKNFPNWTASSRRRLSRPRRIDFAASKQTKANDRRRVFLVMSQPA